MCPMCIATAAAAVATIAGSASAAGGVTALVIRRLRSASARAGLSSQADNGVVDESSEGRRGS